MALAPRGVNAEPKTVGAIFRAQVTARADRTALEQGLRALTYAELDARTNRLARALEAAGAQSGTRVAILSENRLEYVEVELACAKLGAIAACLNWRQADPEMRHCIQLVQPALVLASGRFMPVLARVDHGCPAVVCLDDGYETWLARYPAAPIEELAEPEDGLIILYTSGTTGLPKAAVISHRAVVARSRVHEMDRPTEIDDAFVAWTPMFHMGATDFVFSTVLRGGRVIVMDGFDPAALANVVARERLGWLHVMPGTTERLLAELARRDVKPAGVRFAGVMPDLVPRRMIAELTTRLGAPYPNTFGSTEAGSMLSRSLIPVGEVPQRLSKRKSSFCEVRLVDEAGGEVAQGEPGELEVRGPGLFSGYWGAAEPALRDGWYATGDVFVQNPDGSFDFVDRRKYLIKSGGENIYPAEIERVLRAQPGVAEAVVVRRRDEKWGEVPIAFVVAREPRPSADELLAACRSQIARYKLPRELRFVTDAELPRSVSGKVLRHDLEARLEKEVS
jgi:acyl-CoA synthetase (AMP-forming)/AMP-acid ligase II